MCRPGDFFTVDIADDRALIVRGEDGASAPSTICAGIAARASRRTSRGHCERAGLPVPWLGLQSRRHAARPCAAAEPSAVSTEAKFGLKPIELRNLDGLHLHPLPHRSAGERGRDHGALCAAKSRPTAWKISFPRHLPRRSSLTSTGSRCATSTTKAITWRWPIPHCRISMARTYFDRPYVQRREPLGRPLRAPGRAGCGACAITWRSVPGRTGSRRTSGSSGSIIGLFPNTVIAVTPELVQFYQEFPLGVDRTLIRGAVYRRPERKPRAAPGALSRHAHRPGNRQGRHPALRFGRTSR